MDEPPSAVPESPAPTVPPADLRGSAAPAADAEDAARDLARLGELLLGERPSLTAADVAARSGLAVADVIAYWHALGLHVADPDERVFTAGDAEVIGAFIAASRRYGMRQGSGVSLVRAMGHSIERLVAWQTETLVDHIATRYGLRDGPARALLLDRLNDVAGLLEVGVVHAWHRHLLANAERMAQTAAEPPDGDTDELPLARAVGLADVVGFTTRTADLGAGALAEYVQGFEAQARDVVAAGGGRVVKTVGDALLFVADDPATGARVALDLVAALGPETDAPLRVGLVWGRVLARFGDVFGPAVALASRLCDLAGPGRVLVDELTAADLPEFLVEPLDVREVAGIGPVRPHLLVAELRPAR